MQSRRIWLPVITAEGNALAAMGRPGAVVADRGGRGLTLDDRVVLVGPEGGWSASELEAASDTVVIVLRRRDWLSPAGLSSELAVERRFGCSVVSIGAGRKNDDACCGKQGGKEQDEDSAGS